MGGPSLAFHGSVDTGVIATATTLLDGRQYQGLVAVCNDALGLDPTCVPLLVMRARAQMALRRDLDAQVDLCDVIRLEPGCATAYRLFGELAARRDEHDSASIFFREALRLDPTDREAADWLLIVEGWARSAESARFASGTESPRTEPDDRPTAPFARGSQPARVAGWKATGRALVYPRPIGGHPAPPSLHRSPVPDYPLRNAAPELPGFGEYLVTSGILTRERLRAAQIYQRSMKVQLSSALITLGFTTAQRLEWAAVAHHAKLARADEPR